MLEKLKIVQPLMKWACHYARLQPFYFHGECITLIIEVKITSTKVMKHEQDNVNYEM